MPITRYAVKNLATGQYLGPKLWTAKRVNARWFASKEHALKTLDTHAITTEIEIEKFKIPCANDMANRAIADYHKFPKV